MLLPRKMKRKMTSEDADAILERAKTEEPLEIEKNDIKAMILAGIIVFVPFLLAFSGVIVFLYWFITRVWAS
jgi:membrane protein insertase Oxa1/YidC/SpoIIIJ